MPKQKLGRQLFAALAAFCGFGLTMLQVCKYDFNKTTTAVIEPSVANIGTQMLGVNDSGYALPFELVSILLLAAMIGSIVIALKTRNQAI
jgi:NADH-quinone oxidoreductase subunit J